MLFLVISEPRPERPSEVAEQRRRFWSWIGPLLASGEARSVDARVGRGAVVLFDLPDHAALHRRLTEWAEMVPAGFQTLPLLDAEAARGQLASP